MAAAALHAQSRRADQPLIIKNCGTFDKELLRSELFGYCKGAFTGADRSTDGLLTLAHKGTLFFDEVGELSLELQGALLRVLETQHFRRVGDKEERCVDVRFIFATNKNLPRRSRRAGSTTPSTTASTSSPSSFRPCANAARTSRPWSSISSCPWPRTARSTKSPPGPAAAHGQPLARQRARAQEHHRARHDPAENNLINVKALPFCQKSCQNPRDKGFSTLEELERSHISMVMHAVQGNKSRAAQLLGIGRKTLYRKLEEYS